ncbi:MAG TPA: serine/threonine-protein kinase [Polyangiaceae bacterium]
MSDPPDELELAQARIGRVLNDKWTLERLLGVGGMAAVYEARHRNGARAAVKILHAELGLQPNLRERFVHEGYAANRVEHPDVVKVLDDDVISGGPDDGAAFLVMELLEGRSLEARVADGAPLTELELLEIVDAVLAVLESAHARGIIHRDLKPENLFLVAPDEAGHSQVKVLDFGIARTVESRGNTVHGVPMGTPAFMAPEQASGRVDDIDGRTDLFALGATMFTVLAGRSVHEGDDPLEAMYKMVKEQAPPLRSVAPRVSEACARIVDKALQLERESRYASATAMRADVRAVLDAGRTQPVTLGTAPTLAAAPAREASIPPPPRKSGCGTRVAFVALLLACVAGAWVTFGKGLSLPRVLRDASDLVPTASTSLAETPSASPSSSSSAVAPTPIVVVVDAEAALDAAPDASDDADEQDEDGGDDASRDASGLDATPSVHVAATARPTATTKPPIVTHPTAKPTGTTKPKPHR